VRDAAWPNGAYAAEFTSADALDDAVRTLADKGYTLIETYSPVSLKRGVRQPRSLLPAIVFLGGLLGAIASYAIQWYANAYAYPIDIGGRPAHAIPAFLIPTFEGTVLCASLTAFFGFFVITRLPRYWHPIFELAGFDRATVDRYWLAIDAADHRSGPEVTVHELQALSPVRIVRLESRHA
jgi:ActD protein